MRCGQLLCCSTPSFPGVSVTSLPHFHSLHLSLSLSVSRELYESELHSTGQAGQMVTGRGGLALGGLSQTLPGGNPDIRP